jgi:hypothetical protein
LSIEENEMLYILERGDDGWWKVKKKAEGEQEEGDEGLVPANYVEEVSRTDCHKHLSLIPSGRPDLSRNSNV